MSGRRRPTWWSEVPSGLLGMIALVACFESYLARHSAEFSNRESESWRESLRAARGAAIGADVLCLGDSLTKLGLLPSVMERGLRRPVYNLAIIAGTTPATYILLRTALSSGAHPAALVINCEPSMLASPPQYHTRNWPELLRLRDAWQLASTAHDASLFACIALGKALPSVNSRAELRNMILANLNGHRVNILPEIAAHLRNWNHNKGAMVSPKNLNNADDADPPNRLLSSDDWRCHIVNAVYLKKLLSLAASREVPIFFVLPPAVPQVQARRERQGYDAAYIRFVRSVQARYPNLVVLDARHSGYAHTLFTDALHLDREGAARFSADVADALARSLDHPNGGPRWVALPTGSAAPLDIPLEDMDQSRFALRFMMEARR
jgi:hypothetical protein